MSRPFAHYPALPVGLDEDEPSAFRKVAPWLLAFCATLGIHTAIYLWLTGETAPPRAPIPDQPAAVMIDLAPEVQTAASEVDQALGRPMQAADEDPPPPEEAKPDPIPDVPQALAEAVAALPPPPPQKIDKPVVKPVEKKPPPQKPVEKKKVARKPVAQQSSGAPQSNSKTERTTASAAGSTVSPAAKADWSNEVRAKIERSKRYPAGADQYGTPTVRVSLGRSGNIVGAVLASSSGSPDLDNEALATVRRASPLPPPPAGLGGAVTSFTFRINFRRR